MTTSLVRWVACVALSLLSLSPSTVGAQRDTTLVPRALLTALVSHFADRYGEPGDQNIQVGALPPELTARIGLPPNGRVIGSVNFRTSSVVFGDAPGNAASLLSWFSNDFRARGYVPHSVSEEARGFVSPTIGPVTDWCDGNRWLSMRTRNDRTTLTMASFEIAVHDEGGCGRSMQSARSRDDPMLVERRKLPLLVNPGGAQRSESCSEWPGISGGMPFDRSAESSYRSPLTPAQILTHYGRQLDSTGWRRQPLAPAAWGVWTKVDSGVTRHATLMITPIVDTDNCRHAILQVYRPSK